MGLVYKICDREAWQAALENGAYEGSDTDRRDGFIHLSAAHQLAETARRHFHGMTDLVLIVLVEQELGPALKWEKSRGGDLFPHLYGPIDARRMHRVFPLPWRDEMHEFPPSIFP